MENRVPHSTQTKAQLRAQLRAVAKMYFETNPQRSVRSIQTHLRYVYGQGMRHETLAQIKANVAAAQMIGRLPNVAHVDPLPEPKPEYGYSVEPQGTRAKPWPEMSSIVAVGGVLLLITIFILIYALGPIGR